MIPTVNFSKARFVLTMAFCFLIPACEKPSLTPPGKKVEASASVEGVSKPAVQERAKVELIESAGKEIETQRIVAEKRMPEPGEGVIQSREKTPNPVENPNALNIRYPIGRTLIDYQKQNKTPADIIGRDGEFITVILKSSGERVAIPISELSTPDQTFVSFLPVKAPPPVKKILPKPTYIVLREKDLKNLRNQAKVMRQDMVRNRKKLLIVRGIKGRLKIVEEKIREVEQEITIYKAVNGIVD